VIVSRPLSLFELGARNRAEGRMSFSLRLVHARDRLRIFSRACLVCVHMYACMHMRCIACIQATSPWPRPASRTSDFAIARRGLPLRNKTSFAEVTRRYHPGSAVFLAAGFFRSNACSARRRSARRCVSPTKARFRLDVPSSTIHHLPSFRPSLAIGRCQHTTTIRSRKGVHCVSPPLKTCGLERKKVWFGFITEKRLWKKQQ
jgi:hypothetical protein